MTRWTNPLDQLLDELRSVGAKCGEQDSQPATVVQDGKMLFGIDGKLMFTEEAREYLRELRSRPTPQS
jgi:hypothetical protein